MNIHGKKDEILFFQSQVLQCEYIAFHRIIDKKFRRKVFH